MNPERSAFGMSMIVHWDTPLLERFWSKVDTSRPDECWPWTAGQNARGYGRVNWNGHNRLAHRIAYEISTGPIPDGLTLDHLCRNKACCNPAHLEPVSSRENLLRASPGAHNRTKTHCPHGHPYSGNNLIVKLGRRFCRVCENAQQRARYQRRNAK